MVRTIELESGIVSGDDKRALVQVIPEAETAFTGRKTYDEYYFKPLEVNVTAEQIDLLSLRWKITIGYDTIVVHDGY